MKKTTNYDSFTAISNNLKPWYKSADLSVMACKVSKGDNSQLLPLATAIATATLKGLARREGYNPKQSATKAYYNLVCEKEQDFVNDAVLIIYDILSQYGTMTKKLAVRTTTKRVVPINQVSFDDMVTTLYINPVSLAIKRLTLQFENQRNKITYGYSYQEIGTLPFYGVETPIYARMHKFYDENTCADAVAIDNLVSKLSLTDRQATVIKYRLQGYGEKAIAKKLGVSKTAIQNTLARVYRQAEKIGLLDTEKGAEMA